jgi:flagellar hook-associated protein 2
MPRANYIQVKSAVTSNGDQTYTRGPLADDNIFDDLRNNMFDMIMTPVTNSGIFKSLNDLGITIDDNLKITISDSTKLDKALNNNFSDVTALLDNVMGKFDATLNNFTGTNGYVTTQANSLTSDVSDMNAKIAEMKTELTARQQQLVDQYGAMQAALSLMTANANTWASIYSGAQNLFNNSSSTTSTTA